MSSTTITKKPIGSCAACNKEGAVLQCAPCRDAGVDVFFCNRECQVKQWKTHKVVCKKKTSTTHPKKEQSSAKKEAEAEGMKGLQHRKNTQICDNCLKKGVKRVAELSVCSKCKSAYYCSPECQVEDWPEHKRMCKNFCEASKNIERSFDSSEKDVCHLFQKWVRKASSMNCFSNAVYLAIKKKGIEQQPPMKAVRLEVEFDYNAQTFIVAEEPRAVAIADLSQEQKEMSTFVFKELGGRYDQTYTHFVIVSTKELGGRFESNIPLGITKSELDQMNAADIDMLQLHNMCPKVRLKSNLFRGWKSIRRSNLQKQMKLSQSFTAFVQNALQFFCNKSLQNTHRIVVFMNMGKEIGQISQILRYGVVSIAEFKQMKEKLDKIIIRVEDIDSQTRPCTDMAIETLFLDSDACFGFEYTVLCGVNVIQNKTAKQCEKAEDKYFQKLKQDVDFR